MAFFACSQRCFWFFGGFFALQNEPEREKTTPMYLNSFTFSKKILSNKNSFFGIGPFEKTNIFVLLILTFNFHCSQYKQNSFKAICKSFGSSTRMTVSCFVNHYISFYRLIVPGHQYTQRIKWRQIFTLPHPYITAEKLMTIFDLIPIYVFFFT